MKNIPSAVNMYSSQLLLCSLIPCSAVQAPHYEENVVVTQYSSEMAYCGMNILAHLLQLSHGAKMGAQLMGCVTVVHLLQIIIHSREWSALLSLLDLVMSNPLIHFPLMFPFFVMIAN